MNVVPFAEEHLKEALAIYLEVFRAPPWNESWTEEAARAQLALIRGLRGARGWAMLEDGTLAGFVLGYAGRMRAGEPAYFLIEMAVRADRQRAGLGTALLAVVEDELRAAGIPGMRIVTAAHKWPRRFYEKNGYTAEREDEHGQVILTRAL